MRNVGANSRLDFFIKKTALWSCQLEKKNYFQTLFAETTPE
jgi:hypothetical protein